MAGTVIMCIVTFGCAILFFAIGVYAKRLQKPRWFYSGTEVSPAQITDVRQYNRENGVMWQTYSLWYFAAGLAEFFHPAAALTFLLLGCSIGIALLVWKYHKIYQKYSV